MEYYRISRTAEPKIIGIKTGTSQVELLHEHLENNEDLKNFENHFSGYNLKFWEEQDSISQLNPPPFTGRLRKGAKLTDLMKYGQMYSYLNNIYSSSYIEIIKKFNIPNYFLFDFIIKDVPELYYFFYVKMITFDEIIFDKSIILSGLHVLNNVKYHDVKNLEAYKELKKHFPLASFEKIAIPKRYYGRDIIESRASGQPFYSERLIEALLENGMSGLEIHHKQRVKLEFV